MYMLEVKILQMTFFICEMAMANSVPVTKTVHLEFDYSSLCQT